MSPYSSISLQHPRLSASCSRVASLLRDLDESLLSLEARWGGVTQPAEAGWTETKLVVSQARQVKVPGVRALMLRSWRVLKLGPMAAGLSGDNTCVEPGSTHVWNLDTCEQQ